MIFTHNQVILPDIKQLPKDENGDRFYLIPWNSSDGVYLPSDVKKIPSVTTILSRMPEPPALKEWQKRLGEKEANRFMRMIASRGTSLHSCIERYLGNDPEPTKGFMPDVKAMFRGLKPLLDQNVNNIRCIEGRVCSIKHLYAGSLDLACSWNTVKSAIIDFKNSNSDKEINIEKCKGKYFIQTAAYAIAFEELTGIPTNFGVILFGSNDYEPMAVESGLTKYKEEWLDLRRSVKL
jgi:hypothetical protein